MCIHCGCRFCSRPGLAYHYRYKVCGLFSDEVTKTVVERLRDWAGSSKGSPAGDGPIRNQDSAPSQEVNQFSPSSEAYAVLPPEERQQLVAELRATEEKYSILLREAMQLQDPERALRIVQLKNRYNTKQSTTRKKYGIRLRKIRPPEELAAERRRLFGSSDRLSACSNGPQSTLTKSTVTDAGAQAAEQEAAQRPSIRGSSRRSIAEESSVPTLLNWPETRDSSAAATQTQQSVVSTYASGQVAKGTQADPVVMDASESGTGSISSSDSSIWDDIPARRSGV